MTRRNRHKNRQSIRLQGYDYSWPGEYFVTICTQNRVHRFGTVVSGEMVLNECGKIASEYWHKIPGRFKNVNLDAFVVMPDHVHGIIRIEYHPQTAGGFHPSPLRRWGHRQRNGDPDQETYRKQRRQMLLSKIMGWYKMNVAKQANILLNQSGNRFWQRNYYEHIIRNDGALFRIRNYIINNPKKWEEDLKHPNNK